MVIRVVILRTDSSDQLTDTCAVLPPAKYKVLKTSSSISREKMLFNTEPPAPVGSPRYQLIRFNGCAA